MNDDLVLLERTSQNPHIATLTLNRPDKGNALNTPMLVALTSKLDEVERDTSIRVMIMRSAGDNASFGADLNELVAKGPAGYTNIDWDDATKHIDDGRIVAEKLFLLRVPTIGIIHGYCLGGGAEMYTMCDILYGASGGPEQGGMFYGFPETTIGVMPGWMGPEILIKRIGPGFARDLLYTGRTINGDEALRMGIVRALYLKGELLAAAMTWATAVAANAPLAVESTRRVINNILFPDFMSVMGSTGSETADNLMSSDFVKGATKILNKETTQPEYERG